MIEVKQADRDVMVLLDRAAVTYQVVLTKADGLKPPALARKQDEVRQLIRVHPAAFPEIAVTSAETGLGIPELRAVLTQLTAIAPGREHLRFHEGERRCQPRTGKQYLAGLREQNREVWFRGERVKDVTTHPRSRPRARGLSPRCTINRATRNTAPR